MTLVWRKLIKRLTITDTRQAVVRRIGIQSLKTAETFSAHTFSVLNKLVLKKRMAVLTGKNLKTTANLSNCHSSHTQHISRIPSLSSSTTALQCQIPLK